MFVVVVVVSVRRTVLSFESQTTGFEEVRVVWKEFFLCHQMAPTTFSERQTNQPLFAFI
jgi:hypothetical protein